MTDEQALRGYDPAAGQHHHPDLIYSTCLARFQYVPVGKMSDPFWIDYHLQQGHYTHCGYIEYPSGEAAYMTTDPDIQLSGWNRQQWSFDQRLQQVLTPPDMTPAEMAKPIWHNMLLEQHAKYTAFLQANLEQPLPFEQWVKTGK